jgi:photosystem II stability/assembly factor-like uncharacterized protein
LIAAALASIIVATFLYLRAATPTAPSAELPPATPTLSGYSAAYDFVTASTGWALVTRERQYWIFRTVDGARHWQMQDTGQVAYGEPVVHFVDRTHGEIAFFGGELRMYQTSDAGVHWRPLVVPGEAFAVTFADATNGWALTWNPAARALQLLYSGDGGETWTERVWPAGAYWVGRGGIGALAFKAGGQGWIGGDGAEPRLLGTVDGGSSWRSTRVEIPPGALSALPEGTQVFITQLTLMPQRGIFAVVSDLTGDLIGLTSMDSGQTWRTLAPAPEPTRYADISFADDTHWWASRYGYLFKTSDGGQTWQPVGVKPLLADWNYQPAHAIDSMHAWSQMISTAHSTDSALAMTSDGGVTWTSMNVPRPG